MQGIRLLTKHLPCLHILSKHLHFTLSGEVVARSARSRCLAFLYR